MIAYSHHEPTAFLGYELGAHATQESLGIEDVMDIGAKRQLTNLVFRTDVAMQTGLDVALVDNVFAGLSSQFCPLSSSFHVAPFYSVNGICCVPQGREELYDIGVVGGLFAVESQVGMQFQLFGGLPAQHEV